MEVPRKCSILQVNRALRQEGSDIFQRNNEFMLMSNHARYLQADSLGSFLRSWFGREAAVRLHTASAKSAKHSFVQNHMIVPGQGLEEEPTSYPPSQEYKYLASNDVELLGASTILLLLAI